MLLDTRTLFAVAALAHAALALALLAVWRGNRNVAGLGELVSGHASIVAGLLLVGLWRNELPEVVSVVPGNAALLLGAAWCGAGIQRLFGRRPPRWRAAAVAAVSAGALAYLFEVRPGASARVLLVSSLVAAAWLAAALTAAAALRHPDERLASGMIALGIGGPGALHAGRALAVLAGARAASILDGSLLTNAVLAADVAGSIIWVVGVIVLVNQRLKGALSATAERLATSEAMANSLIQNAPDAIVLLDARTGLFASHNAQARRLFGCSEEELSRLGPAELSPERQPDGSLSRESARARIEEALRGGMPTFEWMHQRRSGEPVLCEVRLLRLPNAEGPLVRGSMLDISERKRAEEERERSRLLLEEAQSLAHAGHWIWEVETGRATASHQMLAILGLSPDAELSLESMAGTVHLEDRERIASARRLAQESGRGYELRYRIQRPGAALRWIEARGRLQRDPAGRATHVIEVAQDVTERIGMEDSLRRAELSAALGGLVAGAAHEVRNPLFAISATLDAFTARFGRRPEYEHFIHNLTREVDRLARLMRQLLEYGKPRSQRLQPASPERVVELARVECASLAASRGVKLEVSADERLPELAMDQPSLVRALVNVVQNALHYAPPGTAVSIQTSLLSEDGGRGWLEVSVRDRGPGFPVAERERVFEPFFTLRPGGTGLGLSIVERIVEAHGGRIQADNAPEGGARVAMAFPVVAPALPSRG
jgi:PAS domain S-box-containing protein